MSGKPPAQPSAPHLSAFRIVKRKFAHGAFSGTGARLYGGRWNSIGTPMVYTAGSLSLAVLEWRVHLAQWPPPPLLIVQVQFEESLVWAPARFPAGWDRFPALPSVAAFGDRWINSLRSVILRVPSAVVPGEWNYLLNPKHPEFGKLLIGRPRLFRPDRRLAPLNP